MSGDETYRLDDGLLREAEECVPLIRAAVTASQEAAEELRARFVDLAPEGFEETEHAETVELAAYGVAANRVIAAFPDASLTEVATGWEDRWREFHHSIRIGPLWVGPPWESPPSEAIAVVIDPGQAFGTGAHATTRLCLELLLEQQRGSLLDVGCGSGVIAIAAARLGFAPVVALDHDPAAVEAANANAAANGVTIDVRQADLRHEDLHEAELVVANITLAAIQALGPRLAAKRVVTAGYLTSDQPVLAGFAKVERRELAGWAADLFQAR